MVSCNETDNEATTSRLHAFGLGAVTNADEARAIECQSQLVSHISQLPGTVVGLFVGKYCKLVMSLLY